MASLNTRKLYAAFTIPTGSQFDAFLDDIESFLNSTKLNDDNIQDNGITASDKLIDETVTAAKIANAAVTAVKLASDSVQTAKIVNGAVTVDKLASNSVTTAKIGDSQVTTAQIATNAVTMAKLETRTTGTGVGGISLSSSSGTTTTTSSSSLLSASITTTGRPVFVGLIPDGSANEAYIYHPGKLIARL